MERKVLLSVFLLILPFGSFGAGLHGISKRATGGGHSWGYEGNTGPKSWKNKYPECDDRSQSPINIDTDKVYLNENLDDFDFDNFEIDFKNAKMKNNGHTIKVEPGKDEAARTFTHGGFDNEHQFLQLHFHWGSRDSQGSEHLIDSKAYPLEMHMVCMNKKYQSIEEATNHTDGLAVLGVLFKVDEEDNEDLEPLISELSDVRKENSETKVKSFDLRSLLPDNTMPYYRYQGSLTTPPCLEIVTWTVFKEFSEISARQLGLFRQITFNEDGKAEKLVNNFRPPQPLERRSVEISGKTNSASSLIPTVLTTLFAALSLIL